MKKQRKAETPKPKVYLVSFKIRTTEKRGWVIEDAGRTAIDLMVGLRRYDANARLVMKPRVEEVGTR